MNPQKNKANISLELNAAEICCSNVTGSEVGQTEVMKEKQTIF